MVEGTATLLHGIFRLFDFCGDVKMPWQSHTCTFGFTNHVCRIRLGGLVEVFGLSSAELQVAAKSSRSFSMHLADRTGVRPGHQRFRRTGRAVSWYLFLRAETQRFQHICCEAVSFDSASGKFHVYLSCGAARAPDSDSCFLFHFSSGAF